MKKQLNVETPVGLFTRTTNTEYKFVCVRENDNCKSLFEKCKAEGHPPCGNAARMIVKNRGYIVSWHKTAGAAHKAALDLFYWGKASLVGIYEVV
jgi:hypothetical protein